ncbi:MAG: hypothetical protein RBT02_05115 [Bacteroidales bacterium]|jgi:hypothetical protein|nr:hypothetical protein [Bacteroidales bacterium]
MKTFKVLILFLAVIALTGCKYKTMSEQLEIEKQDLTMQLAKSDSTLKQYVSVMQESVLKINSLLGEDVTGSQQAMGEDLPARLDQAIGQITASMEQTEQKYQAARGRYASAANKIKALENEVGELKVLVERKDSLINVLNDKCVALGATIEEQATVIDEVKNTNSELENKVTEITGTLNTAWYAMGTKEALTDSNIITKTGGFLGFLGRVKVLSPTVTSSRLMKIDIRDKTTFEIKCTLDDVQFITLHPSGSYSLATVDAETVSLTINDPAKFWEGSRYLVILY